MRQTPMVTFPKFRGWPSRTSSMFGVETPAPSSLEALSNEILDYGSHGFLGGVMNRRFGSQKKTKLQQKIMRQRQLCHRDGDKSRFDFHFGTDAHGCQVIDQA